MTRDELRSKIEHIVSRGMVSKQPSAHGGRFYVVDLSMKALPEKYDDEDEAENVLTELKVEAIMELIP